MNFISIVINNLIVIDLVLKEVTLKKMLIEDDEFVDHEVCTQ